MPKASRKKQTRAARQQAAEGPAGSRNDIANPSNGPKERAAASVPILKKLENPETSADDKRWACAGLANLVADMDANQRRMLQSQKIVDTLIRLVQEADILVQAEAVGALRNLAVAGGSEICAEMVNKGLVAGLTGHFEAISSRVTGSIEYSEDGHTHGMLWDWAENLSVLIWSLA